MRWFETCFSASDCALCRVICRLRSVICWSRPSLVVARADFASINSFENVSDAEWQVSSRLERVIASPLKSATSVWHEDSRFEALVIASASLSCCASLVRLLTKRDTANPRQTNPRITLDKCFIQQKIFHRLADANSPRGGLLLQFGVKFRAGLDRRQEKWSFCGLPLSN